MPRSLPQYYHTLSPFQDYFGQGTPILTYHKLGPRPRGVRLKGLYVPTARFCRQMQELHQAGFQSTSLSRIAETSDSVPRRVVVTFDDGFANVLQHGLTALADCGFVAIQFLVPGLLGRRNEWDLPLGEVPEALMDVAQIREWLGAGHEIGAHSVTHPHLTRIPLAQAREEVFASKKALEDTFGLPVRHFCYPYGDRNEAIEDFVREAGFDTACGTQFGLAGFKAARHRLPRIGVRHPSRSLKSLLRRLFGP